MRLDDLAAQRQSQPGAALALGVEAEGMRCVVTDTIMRTPEVAADLARVVLGSAREEAR